MTRRWFSMCVLFLCVLGCGLWHGGKASPDAASVVVVGFDGLDWGLLDRLIADGRCPTFAAMKAGGAWADLRSHEPVLSPLIWTTIATGRPPEVHGILDFVMRDPESGRTVPVSSRLRRVPAFWNVLTDAGRTVNVVNWWATHPVEPVSGVMVSERPFAQLFGREAVLDSTDVHPPEALDEVAEFLVAAEDLGWEDLAPFVDLDRRDLERRLADAETSSAPYEDRLNHLRKILATTRSVFAVGRHLVAHEPADLTALYVEGPDTVGHRFAHYLPPRLPWVDAGEQRAFSATMAMYYELCDRELGRLMASAPADTTWIVVTDHGFHTGAARPSVQPDDFGTGAARWHRMVGVFLATGPIIRPGRLSSVSVDDLARTILWLGDAPVADDLDGRELVDLMTDAWRADHPVRRVPTFDDRPRPWQEAVTGHGALEAARLAELQALGYIEADSGAGSPDAPSHTTVFNRARTAEARGDLEEARRLFQATLDLRPEFVWAMLELYEMERDAGHREAALLWLARAMATEHPQLPAWLPVAFVYEARATGRLSQAAAVLRAAPPVVAGRPEWRAAEALAVAWSGRPEAGRRALAEVLDESPGLVDAVDGLARLGDPQWEGRAASAREVVRTDLGGLNRLGRVYARHGRPVEAAKCFREVLASDPHNELALRDLRALEGFPPRP